MAPIKDMETVMKLLFAHAVDEFQQSNAFNNSLLQWYHKAMIAATNTHTHKVMVWTRYAPATKLNNWLRVSRMVEEFTPAVRQLHEQVKLRLPAPSAL